MHTYEFRTAMAADHQARMVAQAEAARMAKTARDARRQDGIGAGRPGGSFLAGLFRRRAAPQPLPAAPAPTPAAAGAGAGGGTGPPLQPSWPTLDRRSRERRVAEVPVAVERRLVPDRRRPSGRGAPTRRRGSVTAGV